MRANWANASLVVASLVTFALVTVALLMTGVAEAAPPKGGLERNSTDIVNQGRRYRAQRPVLSPYLGLTQNGVGNLSAFNYFVLVQPALNQQALNSFQGQELRQLESQVQRNTADISDTLPTNKRAASFMTHRRYFGLVSGASGSGGAAVGGQGQGQGR